MSHVDFTIKQNTTLPVLSATLENSSGEAYDLTDYTVSFRMIAEFDRIDKSVVGTVVVDDALNGEVHYEWQPTDTDTPGIFRCEFVITYLDGKTLAFPTDAYFLIEVLEDRTI